MNGRTIFGGVLFAGLLTSGSALKERHIDTTPSSIPGTTCSIFPADNVWNTPVDDLPVNPKSTEWAASLPGKHLTLGFGPAGERNYGFPFAIVDNDTPMASVAIRDLAESDPGPYPFSAETPIEPYDGGDAHALMINKHTCILYELYDAHWNEGRPKAANGAIFDLRSNALISNSSFPTASDDDAGLPLFPGLVRYDEVQRGKIDHALRFESSRAYSGGVLWPGTYTPTYLNTLDPNVIWMGSRWRLDFRYLPVFSSSTGDFVCVEEVRNVYV